MPAKSPMTFTPNLTLNVEKWLREHGDRFVYINGNSDTWSATAVRPSPAEMLFGIFARQRPRHGKNQNLTSEEKPIDHHH